MALEDVSAVAEPIEPVIEEVEQPIDAVEPVEPDAPEPEEVEEPEAAIDGRTIPEHLKPILKEHKELRTLWHERAAFRKEFPEGPAQAAEVMSILADVGGREGVETLKADVQGFKVSDQQMMSGDPALIQRMATSYPEGFTKLAPEVMTTWYQVDPEGCNKTLCGVIANTFATGGFSNQIERANLYLEVGQPEKAAQVLAEIQKWSQTFGEIAKKPTEQKAPPVDQRSQELDARESQLFNQDLGSKIASFRDPLIEKELAPWIPKGQTLSETKRAMVQREVLLEAGKLLKADTAFGKKWDAFTANKDADGAAKLSRQKQEEILPHIVKSVARELLGSPVRKAPTAAAAPPVATRVTPPPTNKVKTFDDIFNAAVAR